MYSPRDPSPMIYEYSEINYPPSHIPNARGADADYFTLFEFSAKWDPVPAMLTQNHVSIINGFRGGTTDMAPRQEIVFIGVGMVREGRARCVCVCVW